MSDTELAAPVYLTTPLERGDRVGTVTGIENVAALITAYDAPCEIVAVAVPVGQGVIVEHWLSKALGVESDASVTKQP